MPQPTRSVCALALILAIGLAAAVRAGGATFEVKPREEARGLEQAKPPTSAAIKSAWPHEGEKELLERWLAGETVIMNTKEGPVVLDTTPAGFSHLVERAGLPELRQYSTSIADANSVTLAAVGSLAALGPARIRAARRALEERANLLGAEALLRIEVCKAGQIEAPGQPAPKVEELLELAQQLQGKLSAFDQGDPNGATFQSVGLLEVLLKAARLLVAITGVRPDGSRSFIGTGFYVDGSLVTAAHVLTDPLVWPRSAPPEAADRLETLQAGRLAALPQAVSSLGSFDLNGAAMVLGPRANFKVIPELDLAILPLAPDEQQPPEIKAAIALMKEAAAIVRPADQDLNVGHLYGFTVLGSLAAAPVLKWVPPGHIVFPQTAVPPAFDVGPGGRPSPMAHGDAGFWRAVWVELSARVRGNLQTRLQDLFVEVVRELTRRYAGRGIRRKFTSPLGDDSRLPEYFNRRIPDFPSLGGELISDYGNSGSPVFTVSNDRIVLAGMLLGRTGASNRRPTGDPPSLNNYVRIVPISEIQQH